MAPAPELAPFVWKGLTYKVEPCDLGHPDFQPYVRRGKPITSVPPVFVLKGARGGHYGLFPWGKQELGKPLGMRAINLDSGRKWSATPFGKSWFEEHDGVIKRVGTFIKVRQPRKKVVTLKPLGILPLRTR